VLAKGTLGVVAAIVLSATTAPRDLLAGLERLRLPATLVAILSFMVRYLSVVSDDLQRMRIARESRGYSGSRVGQLTAVAGGVVALFVRSFERGERVHLAMRSRGYTGRNQVGMQDHAHLAPHHLSFGQRRRVAVATVLAMRPEVLVLDEPSGNLDPAARRELADILSSLDVTLLMITHDLPYALQLCERSLLMDQGRVVADGRTRDLLADADLMQAHRLELPYGFNPLSVPGPER